MSIRTYDLYKCKSCGNLWAYSYPDQAWRGFFLPETLAIGYVKKLKRIDRIRVFILILTMLLLAGVILLKNVMGS